MEAWRLTGYTPLLEYWKYIYKQNLLTAEYYLPFIRSYFSQNLTYNLSPHAYQNYIVVSHTMGKNTKRVKEFIESIPDSKLTGLSTSGGTIFKDQDFRLDMQGVRPHPVAITNVFYVTSFQPDMGSSSKLKVLDD